jgi:myo-inositol-1(or 4)-monophosphatase
MPTAAAESAFVDDLHALAQRLANAGSVQLSRAFRKHLVGLGTKSSPSDLVSEADHVSESTIRAMLHKLRPKDGMVGEEGTSVASSTGIYWLVDPLDGTTNFVYGRSDWCVAVAAIRADSADAAERLEGKILTGAVLSPLRKQCYSATCYSPAVCNEVPISPRVGSPLAGSVVGVGFSYLPERRAREGVIIGELLSHVGDIRRQGSAALDLCDVAAGHLEAYVEYSKSPWDIAAGLLIARQAGAYLRVTPGKDMVSNVLAATPELAEQLADLVPERIAN